MVEDISAVILIGDLLEVLEHGNFAELILSISGDKIKAIAIDKAFKKVKRLASKDGNKIKLIGAIVPYEEGGGCELVCGELEIIRGDNG
jgi:hypothetical protein